MKIGILTGSTRPGRKSEAVAKWVFEIAKTRGDAEYELIDLRTYKLPLFDEPKSPASAGGQYTEEHTRIWSAKIDSLDGFIFVTPEYNHSTSAALKNAIDFLYPEWNNKAAAFVSYGAAMGVRAAENLRLVMAEVQVATVREQVLLSLFADFENFSFFKPTPDKQKQVHKMLDQLLPWVKALKHLREEQLPMVLKKSTQTEVSPSH